MGERSAKDKEVAEVIMRDRTAKRVVMLFV